LLRLLILVPVLGVLTLGCRAKPDAADLEEQTSATSFFERFSPERLERVMLEQVARQSVRTKLSIFRLNFADFAGLGGRYDYAVSQVEGGELRRVDRWVLTSSVTPGTLLVNAAGQSLPVLIHLEAGREIEFSRVFRTQTEALAALPRTPLDAPLTLEAARRLSLGEIVSLPVRIGFRLGAQQGAFGLPAGLGARGAAGVFWAGESRLVVTRLDDRRIRLKIMPSESRGVFFHAQMGVSLDLFGYGAFGLINMDRQVERALGLDLFRFSRQLTVDADRLAIDYAIDMSDPVGQRVYETIVARPLRLTSRALRELGSTGPVAQTFIDLAPAEAVHAADLEAPPEERRVARLFHGSNAWLGDARSTRLGTRFWRNHAGRSLTLNWLTTTSDEGEQSRSVWHVLNDNRKVSSLFSQMREENQFSAASLHLAARDWRDLKFVGFNMDWRIGERRLTPQDSADHQGVLKAVLGDWGESLDWETVTPRAGAEKYLLNMRVVWPGELLRVMRDAATREPETFEKQVWLALWSVIPQLEGRFGAYSPGEPVNIRAELGNMMRRTTQSIRQLTRNALEMRWEGVHGSTGRDLVESTLQLGSIQPFDWSARVLTLLERDESAREIAPAFLLALCRIYSVSPYISIEVLRQGSETEHFSLGDFVEKDLYDSVEQSLESISSAGFER
jgi:hypothetical protein